MSDETEPLVGISFGQTRSDEFCHYIWLSGKPLSSRISIVQVDPRWKVYGGPCQKWVVDHKARDAMGLPPDAADTMPTFSNLREAKLYAMRQLVLEDARRRLDK